MKPLTASHPTVRGSRREFLRHTASLGLGLAAAPAILRAADNRPAPSNRITLGVIGTGNQGTNDMAQFLLDERVQVVAVCDVNRESPGYWDGSIRGRDPAKRQVEAHYSKGKPSGTFKGCAAYEDFRELLARPDIDAVLIATPDHWHAIPVIQAARAGKDIYGQKPLSLTITEGRAMSRVVQEKQRIFQTGSQQRSDAKFRHACELVRNGRLGKLHTVKCGLPGGRADYGKTGGRKQPEPIPDGFNYDLWLGPAPWAEYAPARCHVNFRWILDYSGGQVTDWGGHHPDIAQWGMNTEHTGPVAIRNARGKFPEDPLWNTATEFHFECHYENGVQVMISNREKMGVRFEGSEGWVWVTRGQIDAHPESLLQETFGEGETRLYRSDNHYRNFIDCVISRQPTIAPCEAAHRSISLCHLGNIAMLLGRDLRWDPVREQILNDPSAQWMLNRPYRAPWSLDS